LYKQKDRQKLLSAQPAEFLLLTDAASDAAMLHGVLLDHLISSINKLRVVAAPATLTPCLLLPCGCCRVLEGVELWLLVMHH
jgi:hypothetical protein